MLRRASLLVILLSLLAPAAVAAKSGSGWRWVVVERMKYVATGSGTLDVTVPTEPITDHPGQATGDTTEARVRVRVTGPPPSIGRAIRVSATQDCENDYATASSDHTYSFTVRPGQYLVLPVAALKPAKSTVEETDVYCTWAVGVQSPTNGGGVHRATVEVSVYSPANVVASQGSLYDAEQCTITIGAGGNQRACTPLVPKTLK